MDISFDFCLNRLSDIKSLCLIKPNFLGAYFQNINILKNMALKFDVFDICFDARYGQWIIVIFNLET